MSDYNQPVSTTAYLTALTNLKDRDVDAITLCYTDPSNIPAQAIKYNRAGDKFQERIAGVWTDKLISIAGGGTGAATAANARTALGLGTISTQDNNAVNITGGTIAGASISAADINSGLVAQARLGSGSDGSGTHFLADDQTFKTAAPGLYYYTPTLLDSNGTTPVNVCRFTVPASKWLHGEMIEVFIAALAKNNKGADGQMTIKVNVGAGAQVTLGIATFSDLATEYKTPRSLILQRINNDVWIYDRTDQMKFIRGQEDSPAKGISTPTNFTSNNIVTIEATLDDNHASFYFNIQAAQISHKRATP